MSNPNKWAISSRGFNGQFSNKLLVLIDGRSFYLPQFSGVFWEHNDVLLEDVERIEVIRGPGASLWGANAVNGVINIITKQAQDTQGGLLTMGGGTEERGYSGLRYGTKLGNDTYLRLYGKYFNHDGFADTSGHNTSDDWYTGQGGFRLDSEAWVDNLLTVQGDLYQGGAGQIDSLASLSPPYLQVFNDNNIHIEPYEKSFRVRYRIDGVLYDVMQPPLRLKAAITSRVKILGQLDIAERRLPQDGRIKIKMGGREMDYRVSTLPTLFGEKVVLRLLDKGNLQLDMTKLGFGPEALTDFESGLLLPYGMVLVTGPTGSGKSTTLAALLDALNRSEVRHVVTIEDPIEYVHANRRCVFEQVEVGTDSQSFAHALRSALRRDPDVILVSS